jgi:outer membrane biogenesis lipoprotein LolB
MARKPRAVASHGGNSDTEDDLVISTPLGQGIAEITRREGVYIALPPTGNGSARAIRAAHRAGARICATARRTARLAARRAQPGVPAESRYDGQRLAEPRQQGWTIEYLAYEDDGRLPRRLRLTRGALDIRLAIEEWQVAPR